MYVIFHDEKHYGRQSGHLQFEEDPFAKNAQGISKMFHEGSLLMKFLQTKPQNKNMNIKNYDLFYTVTQNRDEKEIDVDENVFDIFEYLYDY